MSPVTLILVLSLTRPVSSALPRTNLRVLLRAVPAMPYRANLLRAFGDAASPAPSAGSSTLVEPLSARELEVLRLLARGRTNHEIADELSIAVTTTKKHLSNLIGKLGVRNRTEAVARARELNLL
jgi:LuxR family maltose regulon positive regulatory protein